MGTVGRSHSHICFHPSSALPTACLSHHSCSSQPLPSTLAVEFCFFQQSASTPPTATLLVHVHIHSTMLVSWPRQLLKVQEATTEWSCQHQKQGPKASVPLEGRTGEWGYQDGGLEPFNSRHVSELLTNQGPSCFLSISCSIHAFLSPDNGAKTLLSPLPYQSGTLG